MYAVAWSLPAKAYVKSLPRAAKGAIGHALYRIQRDPSDGDVKKMRGSDHYRLRVGAHRIIYHIDHGKVIIDVIRAGHRRDVYR